MKAKVKSTGEILDVKEYRGVSDVVYSTLDMNRFFQSSDLDFNIDTSQNKTTINGWVARDRNGSLSLYQTIPERQGNLGYWRDGLGEIDLPPRAFPSLIWQDEPIEVEITIKSKHPNI